MTAPTTDIVVRDVTTAVAKLDPADLVRQRSYIEAEIADLQTLDVADDATAEAVTADLREKMRERDAIEKARKAVKGPADALAKFVQAAFMPTINAYDEYRKLAGDKVAAHQQTKLAAQRAAFDAAAEAASKHDAPGMALALNNAASVDTAAPDGISVRFVWRAEVINADLVPLEWRCPDVARINAEAKATPGDESHRPYIAGVKFDLVPETRVMR